MDRKLVTLFSFGLLVLILSTNLSIAFSAQEDYPFQNVFTWIGQAFNFLKPIFSFMWEGINYLGAKISEGINFLVDKFTDKAVSQGIPTESDPIWTSDKSGYYTKSQSDYRYLQSESDPIWNAQKSGYATTGTCPSGQFIQNATSSGVQCATPSGTGVESDPLWTGNQSNYVTTASLGGYVTGGQLSSNLTGGYVSAGQLSGNLSIYPTSSYLDTNYYNKSISDGRYLQSYTETDSKWTSNQSNYFTKAEDYANDTSTFTTYYYVENSYYNHTQWYINATQTFPTYWVLESYYPNITHLQGNLSTKQNIGDYATGSQLLANLTGGYVSSSQLSGNLSNYQPAGSYLTSESDPKWDSNKTLYHKLSDQITYANISNPPSLTNFVTNNSLGTTLDMWSYNKSLSDEKYQLQTSMGAYSTGTQANNNYTTMNVTINTKAGTGNCGVGQVVQNVTSSGVQCITDSTGSGGGVSDSQLQANLTHMNATVAEWIHGNITTSSPDDPNDARSFSPLYGSPSRSENSSYYTVITQIGPSTVASYQRITTAPTTNTTAGYPAVNFPTAASINGDGGYIIAGNTATNTATLNATKVLYFGMCLRNTATTNRRLLIGTFKTQTTVVMDSALTGVGFKYNSSASTDILTYVCNNGACSTTTIGGLTTQRTCFEYWRNGTHWLFWKDGISVANQTYTNSPTTFVSSAGVWIEATTASAQTVVVDYARIGGFY